MVAPDPATVLFVPARVANYRGLLQRFGDLVDRLGLAAVDSGDTVAVKIHFGDSGTTAHVRPQFARQLVNSRDVVTVPVNGRHFSSVRYASAVHHADSLLCISRFKGHLAVGFGGAIKNLSMGLGSRAMKQAMHAAVRPELRDGALCEACGDCVEICPEGAIALEDPSPRKPSAQGT